MHVEVGNLYKSFFVQKMEIKALQDINLNISPQEILIITGPSGSGKSTLLHLLGLMDEPCSGKIYFDGKEVSSLDHASKAKIRNTSIGFIFQFYYLLPEFNILENIFLPLLISSKKNQDELYNSSLSILRELNLQQRAKHFPSQISGGEQQRIAIARALINNPQIILADEPTGNIDRQTGIKIMDLLYKVVKERNISLIITTHNEELTRYANKVMHLVDGKMV